MCDSGEWESVRHHPLWQLTVEFPYREAEEGGS